MPNIVVPDIPLRLVQETSVRYLPSHDNPTPGTTIRSASKSRSLRACARKLANPTSRPFASNTYLTSAVWNSRRSNSTSGHSGTKVPSTKQSAIRSCMTWSRSVNRDSCASRQTSMCAVVFTPRLWLNTGRMAGHRNRPLNFPDGLSACYQRSRNAT